MSREQLYAMLSEQAAQKNKTEVTPTPPTRLSQAAEGVTESGKIVSHLYLHNKSGI